MMPAIRFNPPLLKFLEGVGKLFSNKVSQYFRIKDFKMVRG
jgi:hypothetical protein